MLADRRLAEFGVAMGQFMRIVALPNAIIETMSGVMGA